VSEKQKAGTAEEFKKKLSSLIKGSLRRERELKKKMEKSAILE
jgi:hypothetical protein